jgi:hypothetical protein
VGWGVGAVSNPPPPPPVSIYESKFQISNFKFYFLFCFHLVYDTSYSLRATKKE